MRNFSFLVILAVGAFYAAVGVLFARFSPEILWRRMAWVVSGGAFAAHIAYEHFRRGNSLRRIAAHVSAAAAIGGFGLAVAANFHSWAANVPHQRSLWIALVAWPVLTGIPAFIVAIIAAAMARRAWPRPKV